MKTAACFATFGGSWCQDVEVSEVVDSGLMQGLLHLPGGGPLILVLLPEVRLGQPSLLLEILHDLCDDLGIVDPHGLGSRPLLVHEEEEDRLVATPHRALPAGDPGAAAAVQAVAVVGGDNAPLHRELVVPVAAVLEEEDSARERLLGIVELPVSLPAAFDGVTETRLLGIVKRLELLIEILDGLFDVLGIGEGQNEVLALTQDELGQHEACWPDVGRPGQRDLDLIRPAGAPLALALGIQTQDASGFTIIIPLHDMSPSLK